MPCYRPLRAYKDAAGGVIWAAKPGTTTMKLPCGQCTGCRLDHSKDWAIRCVHEASIHRDNCWLTLTYNDEHLPPGGSLHYPHYQDFMKRLREHAQRKHNAKLGFYMSGEYGELNLRPHYHACIFGYDFQDKIAFKKTGEGFQLWTSPLLTQLWPFGHAAIGPLNFETAAYTARYVMKKINGQLLLTGWHHYTRIDANGEMWEVEPEFAHMSLRPAIGKNWLEKYLGDVYPEGKTLINAKLVNPPRYYDKQYKKKNDKDMKRIVDARKKDAMKNWKDTTDRRLKVREQVAKAKLSQNRRKL